MAAPRKCKVCKESYAQYPTDDFHICEECSFDLEDLIDLRGSVKDLLSRHSPESIKKMEEFAVLQEVNISLDRKRTVEDE